MAWDGWDGMGWDGEMWVWGRGEASFCVEAGNQSARGAQSRRALCREGGDGQAAECE